MGLSGRRRAKKENRLGACKPSSSFAPRAGGANPIMLNDDDMHPHHAHRSARKRAGNTMRRAFPKTVRETKHTQLLAFEVKRGWNEGLMPAQQPTHPEIQASTNANLYNRNMVRLMETDYSSSVSYSLNKRHRWDFAGRLEAEYEAGEQLRAQNLFLVDAVARGRHGPAVRKLTTNAAYTVAAADELRQHKKDLRRRTKFQPKQQVLENDQFQFSDRVTEAKTERHLTRMGSTSSGRDINVRSIKNECNLWNHLYNVSPNAEEVRLEMQRDFERRISVTVGTCVPCPSLSTKGLLLTEKETHCQKRNLKHDPKKWNRMIREGKRSEFDLQMGMDGCGYYEYEAPEISCETEALGQLSSPVEVSLLDLLQPKMSVNKEKKQAAKARRARQQEQQKQKKQRYDSSLTAASAGGSSGYDSGSEGSEEKEAGDLTESQPATESVDLRLAEVLEATMATRRLTAQVARPLAKTERICELFSQSSRRRSLILSRSTPRKLAVLLRPDLSESVVLEEVEEESPEVSRFAIHHIFAGADEQGPATSASEVAAQDDPFAFLLALAEPFAESVETSTSGDPSAASETVAGWQKVAPITEHQARLTAIQELPMLSDSTTKVTESDDAELIPGGECEICCMPLPLTSTATDTFADGATMLSDCCHHFCNRCWLHHVAGSAARGRAVVSCPGFQCDSVLDAATLLWFCPSRLLAALTSAAFRSWLSERREQLRRRQCPVAHCGQVLEAGDRANCVCGRCGAGLCVGCGREPHWPCDCETAAKYRARMEALGHAKLSLHDLTAKTDVAAKQCPSCFLLMEKGMGCNHMSCPCGEHFCWWCGQPMRNHTSGPCGSWSANARTQKSDYRVQREFTAADSILVPNSSQSRLYCSAVRVRLHRESAKSVIVGGFPRGQLADLFFSYAIRFQTTNSREAVRIAKSSAEQLIEATTQASYLVEFSFAHLDGHRRDKRVDTAVRALGGHLAQLVEFMAADMKEQCVRGYRGPKLTRLACERLLMMRRCLLSKCRLLHCIVTRHRDGKGGLEAASARRSGRSTLSGAVLNV